MTNNKRAGTSVPAHAAFPSIERALRVGPYLAVDLLDQGLAVLVLLLVLAHLLELIGGETLEPLGDLIDGQLVVVRGLQRTEDGDLELRLPGGLFGLPEDLRSLLGDLLGDSQTLLCYLLARLQALLGNLLGGLQPLLGSPLDTPQTFS